MRLLEKMYKDTDIKIDITPNQLSIIMSKIPTQSFRWRKLKVVKGPDNTTIQSDGLKLVFHSFDQSLGSIIGFIDSINGSTTIVRAKGNDGRRSSNVPSSRYCYQTAIVDLTSCTTLSSFIHPLTRAYSDCLTKTQYVLHVTSPVSHLTQIFHSHTFPLHTLWFSESLVVLINYNHTSSSSSAVAEPHSSCCTLTLPLAKLATSCLSVLLLVRLATAGILPQQSCWLYQGSDRT